MKREIVIASTAGLHASLASKVVQLSSMYDTDIKMHYGNNVVDAKSILGLMSLAVPSGENVKISAEGRDAEKVLNAIQKILS